MELLRPKIEIYRTRTFSDKVSDKFDFIRESWRPLLKNFVYLMLPLCIVLAFFYDNFFAGYLSLLGYMGDGDGMRDYDSAMLVRFGCMSLGALVLSFVTGMLLVALVFSMVRLYQSRELRLQQLTWTELRPELKYCLKRSASLLAVGVVLGVLVALLAMLLVFGAGAIHPGLGIVALMILYIGIMVVVLPLSLLAPVYMLEDYIGILPAIEKSFRLGFATWGGIFAVGFVMSLLGSVLQTITFMPWYIMVLAKTLFMLEGDTTGLMSAAGFSFLQYLLCVWMLLGYLLTSVLMLVALTMQYGHAADIVDGVGVSQKIEKFDELEAF
ncbi:MAG: hypothetical protein IJV24_06950 [Prevotella sp.]|nr:hypothetical protein [Prevotella sp.]